MSKKTTKIDYATLTKEEVLKEEFKLLIKEAEERGYTIIPYKHVMENGNRRIKFYGLPEYSLLQKPIWKDDKTFKPRLLQLTLFKGDKEIFQCDSLRDVINYFNQFNEKATEPVLLQNEPNKEGG
jgi:hypothetical protein